MTASILTSPPRADTERAALITQARLNYDSIFPATPLTTDGGKARIQRRRDNFKFRDSNGVRDITDDLMLDHADPSCMPSDSAYHAPESDPA